MPPIPYTERLANNVVAPKTGVHRDSVKTACAPTTLTVTLARLLRQHLTAVGIALFTPLAARPWRPRVAWI